MIVRKVVAGAAIAAGLGVDLSFAADLSSDLASADLLSSWRLSLFGVASLNRSRNLFSRNCGVLGTRSILAIWPGSVRCPVMNNSDLPSVLQVTSSANVFAKKLNRVASPVFTDTA